MTRQPVPATLHPMFTRRANNYRIRALLYAGKPNWALLDTLTPT